MGKKIKRRPRNIDKEKRVSNKVGGDEVAAEKVVGDQGGLDMVVADEVLVVKDRKTCTHVEKGVNLENLKKIELGKLVRCEDCRESSADRRDNKGKGKQGKKKGTGNGGTSKLIWVCLECGHFTCGGVGLPTTPQCHALRHARQNRHHCVVQLDNPQLRWCFVCSSLIPDEKAEKGEEHKDIIKEVVKLIKGRLSGAPVDVENVWFGSSSGNVKDSVKLENAERTGGYVVRGLVNHGNTCFFNSVLQNLIAIDQFRNSFIKLDLFFGPLTSSLKKLLDEASLESNTKNIISPKPVLKCISDRASQFKGYQQQDSHELLRCLLDGLQHEESAAKKVLSSVENEQTSNLGPLFVDMIFGGRLSSTVCCLTCRHSSIVYEPFLDLSLPVPTKKPASENILLASQTKKSKQPLKKEVKRGGKFRGKGKMDALPMLTQCSTSTAERDDSSCLTPSIVPVKEENMAELDDCSWMNFLGKDTSHNGHPSTSQNLEISIGPETQQVCDSDNVLQISLYSQQQVFLPHKEPIPELNSCADDVLLDVQSSEVILLPYKEEFSQNTVIPISSETQQIYESEDVLQNSLDSQQHGFLPNREPNQDLDFPELISYADVVPLQMQVSEVILLPFKGEIETTKEMESKVGEASSSIVVYAQDTLELDGLGDLFNEPEMLSSHGNGKTETLLIAGNMSESDPDEVDDTDAPMSIDRCLAYFVKPELLSNEQAWHCENCSLVAAKENQSKPTLKRQLNGDQLKSKNASLDLDEVRSSNTGFGNSYNGKLETDIGSTTTADCSVPQSEIIGEPNSKYSNGEISPSDKERDLDFGNATFSYRQTSCGEDPQRDIALNQSNSFPLEVSTSIVNSCSDQASDSCSVNEPGSMRKSVQQTPSSKFRLSAGEPSNGGESLDSKGVKVKRDASKRILIDKAPPVLTIHLKRFNQDARGRLSKMNGHVSFLDTIDLKPYMDSRCTYNLIYSFLITV
ncbi:hypothetical protein GIB67_028628 [Kingdonia uniflora]|uniref:ubiquitinyl hydrolase 1 n=1 Tax=Kingdonia uniflora TaxID=39325 RepID=A0A7J7KZP3_9MAGN|nr:hypothetical protein GIB67_028628 [Kingdonia uniflora]